MGVEAQEGTGHTALPGDGTSSILEGKGRKKPGPKARLRNPSPRADEWIEIQLSDGSWVTGWSRDATDSAWVIAEQVDTAERALRRDLKTCRRASWLGRVTVRAAC